MELALLLLLFVVANLVSQAIKRGRQGGPPTGRPPREAGPAAGGQPGGVRDLFDQIRRSMEEAERRARGELDDEDVLVLGRPTPVDEDDAYEGVIEERESLETEPEVQSLETNVPRPQRRMVVQDDAAEALVARRIRYAEQQNRGRTAAEHRAFDARIRRADPLPPPPEVGSPRARELRRLMLWREVLGKPVALRDDR